MPIRTFEETARMSVIPPAEPFTRTSVTLTTKLMTDLDELREAVNGERDKPARFSRDAFLQVGLEWFVRELTAERRKAKK